MSLKAVHLVFVTALTSMALGTGGWKLNDYFSGSKRGADLLFAIGAFAVAGLVVVYGRYFLKKLKSVGYL